MLASRAFPKGQKTDGERKNFIPSNGVGQPELNVPNHSCNGYSFGT